MFYPAFLSLFLVFVYAFIFYLSANTPLIDAQLTNLLNVLGLVVVISLLTAACIAAFFLLLNKLCRFKPVTDTRFTRLVVVVILFLGFLLLIENWSYSLFGTALKTTDTWWLKLLFCLGGVYLAYQFSSGIIKLAAIFTRRNIPVLVLLLLICAVIVSMNLLNRTDDQPVSSSSVKNINKTNVLILSSDGINAREMSVYGSKYETTPFLNSVKDEFMVFDNAYSNNKNTTGSVISMLNGILPLTSKVVYPPDILKGADSLRSLPKILGDAGYYRTLWAVPHYADALSQNMTGAFDVNNIRASSMLSDLSNYLRLESLQQWYFIRVLKDICGVLADVLFIKELANPFSQVDEDTLETVKSPSTLNDKMRLQNVLADIDTALENNSPFFIMTHFMTSHGSKFKPRNSIFSKGIPQSEEWMPEFYRDSILDFDQAIEAVYAKLKKHVQLENTIVIVTSDHGMKYDNRNRIPLLIRLPGSQNSGEYTVNTQLIDIAPTIMQALGLKIPQWMQGNSLFVPDEVADDRFIVITGVRYNKPTGKVWIREADKTQSFSSSNVYSVIYCDYYMKSFYPIRFKPVKLQDRAGDPSCHPKSLPELTQQAELIVNQGFGE